jgi:DNA-binding helix-hairpin-helix protein with protein kinase domain
VVKPTVIGRSGPVPLGSLLGKGGEGAVYEVVGNANLVAKVYLGRISKDRVDKLSVMLSLVTPTLASLTAWPSDLLRLPDGSVGGFLMPNMRGSKDIHTLYSPKSRLSEFPSADWRMLVRAALNTSRAFAVLHEAGCLVGDVNHGGVRVAPDATVKLIDCDSFQVSNGGRTFLCEVGVDTFTPPELQGKQFSTTLRTTNHDNFGLATLIFQMLMMGRHPFAGRYRGPEDMPIPKAIGQFRYAYSRDTSTTGMQIPPNTAPVLAASSQVVGMWEQAFGRSGASSNGRPTAQEWVKALAAIESQFAKCNRNPSHYFLSSHGKCPWCPIEQVGVALFGIAIGAIPSAIGGAFNVDAVWLQIKAIPTPGRAPPVPTIAQPPPSAQAKAVGASRGTWRSGGIFLGIAIFVLGCILTADFWFIWAIAAWAMGALTASRGRADIGPFKAQHQLAKARFDDLGNRWRRETDATQFDTKLSDLQKLRDEWTQLPALRQRRYADLLANRHKHALHQFLDKHEIERATIKGIGEVKKATLESYGIETAADITRNAVMQVPGFGPALTQNLLDWRQKVEGRFKFDPQSSVDPSQVANLDRTIALRRTDIEKELRQGAATLHQLRGTIMTRRQALEGPLHEAARQYAQATSDLAVVD